VQWVLLAYRLPREPSTPRIALWRRLRRLGSIQIGDGLAALPHDERTREQFDWLAAEIEENGGEALVWLAEASTAREQRGLEARLAAAVTEEYERLIDAARAAESHAPTARRRALARLRRNLNEIRGRDYLGSPALSRAEASLDAVATREEVLRAPD